MEFTGMMESKVLDPLQRSFLMSIGFCIGGMGIAIMYKAGVGTTPNALLSDGIHSLLNVSYGMGNAISNVFALIVVAFFARDLIRLGTVLCAFTMGIYINLWGAVLPELPAQSGIVLRTAVVLLGDFILAGGLSFYVSINSGLGPLEGLAELIRRKLKCSYRLAKTLEDIGLLGVGMLCGGRFGIGTVLTVCCTGFFMQWFFGQINKKMPFLQYYKQ